MPTTARGLFSKWRSGRFRNDRRMECEAFYQGAHNGHLEDGLAELQAGFEEEKAEMKKQSITKQKPLEAELDHLGAMARDASRRWAAVQERLGDSVPALAMPLIVALIGAVGLISEALLLAPAMDVLNVTDPNWQRITAFGVSGIMALAFHFAWRSLTSEADSLIGKIISRIIAGFLALGLVLWGVLRGLQVGFAATLNQNPLGEFLTGHPILAGCFYVFVTLGIPVVAASASHFSANQLHIWWEWKTAKNAAKSISKRTARLRKQLEAERETLTHSLKKTDEECRRHCASFRQHHERGGQWGARQEPYWMVSLKATGVALVACVALIGVLEYPELVIVPVIAWLVAFGYFRKKWQSPAPAEYFDLERVHFAEPALDIQNAKRPPIFGRAAAEMNLDRVMHKELQP